uniref:Transcription elongation factor A protein-like 8 n=1 Tax=Theropithecus gelada TaxID=9565 RepID=A0A8D2F0Q6_THEGE
MQKSCEENEGKPQNMPKAEERSPFGGCTTGGRRKSSTFRRRCKPGGRRKQPGQGFKEDTPVRPLNPEEMIRGVDELERLREERKRVRNKFVMMHWKQRHSCSCPYPVCFRP